MTLDQKLQFWNVVGTWLSGLATFAAVVFSLWVVRRQEGVRLTAYVGIRTMVEGNGRDVKDFISIVVTNLHERPLTIHSIGWRIGKRKATRKCIQMVSGNPYSSRCPIELAHGKTATFLVGIDATPNHLREFVEFIGDVSERSLETLRSQVHTSVGKSVDIKPEPGLLKRIKEFKA